MGLVLHDPLVNSRYMATERGKVHYWLVNVIISENIGEKKKKVHYVIVTGFIE